MNETQHKALQASIKHWHENVKRYADGKKMETGSAECACCEYSIKIAGSRMCEVCPIGQYTNSEDCTGTPYYAVVRGLVGPSEMVGWLVALEAGNNPPLYFTGVYEQ
jgi:hypothetical protein